MQYVLLIDEHVIVFVDFLSFSTFTILFFNVTHRTTQGEEIFPLFFLVKFLCVSINIKI